MRLALVVVLAVVSAACGSPGDPVASVDPLVVATTQRPTTAAASSSPETDVTVPGEAPLADQQSSANPSIRALSIDDALLPETAFGAPWESQFRDLDRVGYGNGPNQTDCAAYWVFDRLLGSDGGHAMWWTAGGNANHYVSRSTDHAETLTTMLALVGLASECPVVNWLEGGSFTTETFDLDDALGFRFVDEGSGDITWVVVAAYEDLVSVLHVPLWTAGDGSAVGFTLNDLTRLGTQMYDLLVGAGPAVPGTVSAPSTTTSTTAAATLPTPKLPPERTPMTIPSTPITGLGELLLTDDDLFAGWIVLEIQRSTPSEPDDEFNASCPTATSLDQIDAVLEWEAIYGLPSGGAAGEFIGRFADAGEAARHVEAFAEMWKCELSEDFPGGIVSGGLVAIDGADRAGVLTVDSGEEGTTAFAAVSVGSIVAVFFQELQPGDPGAGGTIDDFLTRAVAKVAAGL